MKKPIQNRFNLTRTPLWAAGKKRLSAAMVFALGISLATAGNVTLRTTDAAGTSSFTGSTNWNPTGVATAGNAYFTGANTIRTTNSTAANITVNFAGDSVSIDAGGRMIGKIGNNGTTVAGTINANFILNGGVFDQAGANSDSAVLNVNGTVTVNAASILGALGGTANGSANFESVNFNAPISGSAALQVSGPGINGGGDTGYIKLSAANPYAGTITVSNGNNNIIASTVNHIVQFNNLNALSNATVNLDSSQANPLSFAAGANVGTFNMGALTGKASQTLSDTAGSAITLSVGGNNSSTTYPGALTGAGNLVKAGSGTFTLTGTHTYSGTTTISAGTLRLGTNGTGGILPAGNSLTVNGNLTINRNNAVVQGTDFSGSAITGSGSFTQAGSGTTTLNAANSYSGTTTISAGKLIISTAQTGAGALTVANGAKLGITVSGASQLPPGTLTLGTSAATTLDFDGVNSTTVAPINAGTVSVGGQVTVNINTGTFAAGNSYPLIHWTTSGPANASSFTLGISPGLTATFSVSSSTLYLDVSAVSDIWAGGINGNWDTTTANWTGNATIFANGQAVLFDDSAAGTTSVTVTAAVQPSGIMVNNNALAYTITSGGANNIGGAGSVTKQNIGTLALSGGANTYTGVTTVNNGVLSVGALANGGAASDIGAATSASANLVLNGGTLQYTGGSASTDRGATLGASGGTVEVTTGGNNLADSGVIVGAGALTKTGNGVLTLSGANTFSGGVNLNAGEMDINNGGSSSANSAVGTGTLTIGANTVIENSSGNDVTLLPNNAQIWNGNFTYNGAANNLNLGTGAVTLTGTRTVTVNANKLTIGGVISGAAGLTKLGAGTLALMGASTFGNNGAFDSALNGGPVIIGNDLAFGSSRLNMADGATLQSADSSAHVITNNLNFGSGAGGNNIFAGTGNLKFTGNAANGTPKTLTVNNPQTEFSGVLSGAIARTVAGTGLLIFSGADTYSGGTTINSGATLQLGNGSTNGSISASGVIDVEGTLKFNRSDAMVQGTHFSSVPIIGAGAVMQVGSGTVTLNAANTYTGGTFVNSGELFITPVYQAAGDVTVANSAKFGVSANSVSNSATIGNLTLGSGGVTTLDFSYGFTGNPTNAALIANTVTVSGTSSIRIGGSFAVGTFPVLKYSGLVGSFNSSVAGPRGVTAVLSNDVVNQILYVTISSIGSGIVWTGTNSVSPNLWDLNTTTNWLIGVQPTIYIENVPPGDAVTFNDAGSGTVLLSNTISPTSVNISNASVNYTFQGTGQINTFGTLTKVGGGAVTLNVPGSFAGRTVLSNGVVNIGANQTFANLSGNSAVAVSAGAPTLTVNSSSNTTFAGNISGALTLTKNGVNVFTTTASNNFSGNLFVKAGEAVVDSGIMTVGNFCSIGQSGTDNGTLTLKGTANFNCNNDFNVGDVVTSAGTLNVQDTASLTVVSLFIGSANGAGSTASGTVTQTGGTVTQSSTATGAFAVGGRVDTTSIGGVGVYNLSGGVLNTAGAIRVGGAGAGTFNQSGGTVNCGVDVNLARFDGSVGTYNLDGGTIRAARFTSSTTVNATLNLNGGVFVATTDSTSIITNIPTVNVRDGGAIVDTTNLNVSISALLQHSSIGGDNATDGGLTKRGNGSLTLTGAGSSYTGPTVIRGGALNFSAGSVASLNNLTVSNAALGLSLNGGATTFGATSVALAGNSALNLNYDLLSGAPAAALNDSGSLTASGTTTINVFGYGWTVGQFTLVDYTGTPLANLSNFVLGALPYGVTATLSNNVADTSIDLVVTAVSVSTWIPLLATDAFGASSFAAAGNWQDGNPPTAGNGYLTRTFALRSPADANAYTFGGTALSVDVGGRFIMKGTNGQVMTVNNLIINGGLVDYANASDSFVETLAGNITLQGAVTSYMGALASVGSETFFVTAPIGGSGNLQLGGANLNNGQDNGVVVFAAMNTYTGTTTIAGGTLLVNGVNGSSPVTVNANATLGGTGSLAGTVNVQAGGNLAPGIPTRGALTNTIGTLTASSAASVSGTVTMKIDRDVLPNSDKFSAPSTTVNSGAALTVANIGSTNLAAGDTFTLFSSPITGAFTSVTLPPLPNGGVYWTNKLAINGTIAVVSTVTVNTNSPFVTNSFADGNLNLSWPADHVGWILQVQTNSLGAGLGTNWVDVPGSATTNAVSIPVSPNLGTVFYRLKY